MVKRILLTFLVVAAFVQPASARETATVVVEGLGKDVEKATQRAAEAALMQVVGSFIDSDTRIEKRKEIRDGIRTRVKSVRSKISEYSQGSIQRLDILDVERDGGFIRVTAKVAVRIEDFKRYIKKVVLAKKKIKKGLLAKFRVAKKQGRNLSDLVNQKLLRPILEYGVLIPEIASEVKSLDDIRESLGPGVYNRITRRLKPGSNDLVIFFYVDVKLNPDFVANARRVLKETADNEYSLEKYYAQDIHNPSVVRHISTIGIGSYYGVPLTLLSRQSRTCKKIQWDNTGGGIHCAYHERPVFYTYPAVPSGVLCKGIKKLKAEFRQPDWYRDDRKGWLTPNLRMRFVAENGKLLREEVLEYESGVTRSAYSYIGIRRDSIPKDSRLVATSSPRVASSQSILLTRGRGGGPGFCSVFIQTSTTFTIVSKVSEAILAKAEGIDLQYVR